MKIAYSQHEYSANFMQALVDGYQSGLEQIVAYCEDAAVAQYSVSDFPDMACTQSDFEHLMAAQNLPHGSIESMYPMSPLQEGLLFESKYRSGVGVNIIYMGSTITGDLNLAVWQQCWDNLVSRYAIFRTSFIGWEQGLPTQVVHNDVILPWLFVDLSDKNEAAQSAYLAELHEAQRKQDFEQSNAPLMRVIMVKINDDTHKFIWVRHHAIADGWSSSKIVRELLVEYEYLAAGIDAPALPIVPYQNYISWLQTKQKTQAVEEYWRDYLRGFDKQTPISVDDAWHKSLDENKTEEYTRDLPDELKTQINQFAQKEDLTVGFVFQLTWAYLLALYSGQRDVLYGTVVSGRPAELDGVDDIVGPLINTLPIRFDLNDIDADYSAWLQQQKRTFVETNEYSFTPLMDIQKLAEIGQGEPLFSSVFLVQNFVTDVQREQIAQEKQRSTIDLVTPGASYKTSYPISTFINLGPEYQIRFVYESSNISKTQAQAFGAVMENILKLMVSGRQSGIWQLAMQCDTLPEQRLALEKERTYFEKQLAGLQTPVRVFSVNNSTNAYQTTQRNLSVDTSPALAAIELVCETREYRAQSLYAAAFGMVVSQCAGMGDVAIGVLASADPTSADSSLLGEGIEAVTLPLRLNLSQGTASDLLQKVEKQLHKRIMHPARSALVMDQACRSKKDNEWLFDSVIHVQNASSAEVPAQNRSLESGRDQARHAPLNTVMPKVLGFVPTLWLNVTQGEVLALTLVHADAVQGERVLAYFESALEVLANALLTQEGRQGQEEKAALALAYQSVLGEAETQHCIEAANTYVYQQDKPSAHDRMTLKAAPQGLIHQHIERAVELHGDNVAVYCGAERLTYTELNQRANQLAHYLTQSCNVVPDTLVGIQIPRSTVDLVVAILGVLKAGGGYVPIDPEYPAARIRYILEDADIDTVLTPELLQSDVLTQFDTSNPNNPNNPSNPNNQSNTPKQYPQHVAYSIYTSGSTGKPKGVLVAHNSAVNLYKWYGDTILSGGEGANLIISSLSFDLTQKNFLATLMYGQAIMLPSESGFVPNNIIECFKQQDISVLNCAPSMFYALLDNVDDHSVFNTLTSLVLGGESIDALLMNTFLQAHPNCRLINSYGPTECTDVTTYHIVPSEQTLTSDIPIGKGVVNTTHYVLDDHLRLCPTHVVGELYLGGEAVSRGYKDRPGLTAERFVPNPFKGELPCVGGDNDSSRLYRTGDLVRRHENGNIEFLGRRDHQVKIRGLRIEIGEIEAEIRDVKGVRNVAVMVHTFPNGKDNLVAYLEFSDDVIQAQTEDRVEQVRFALGDNLPEYMLPSLFMVVDHIKLSPNGKIDRTALPEPDYSEVQAEYVAPRTQLERQLCQLWARLLDVEKVSIDDNFYHLGGHSLLLVQFVAKAGRAGIDLLADDVINAPTIRELAAISGKRVQGTVLVANESETLFSLPNKQGLYKGHKQHLWNITRMVKVANVNIEALEFVAQSLIESHEVLRHYFVLEAGEVVEKRRLASEVHAFTHVDVSHLSGQDLSQDIERQANDFQHSIHLEKQLVRFVLFDCGEHEDSRLLIIVHHALMDAFGINTLMHEVVSRYLSKVNNWNYTPTAGTPMSTFANALQQYANSEQAKAEFDYWHNLPFEQVRSIAEFEDGFAKNNTDDDAHYGEEVVYRNELDAKRSQWLLSDQLINQGMTISDVLLTAWTNTLASLSGSNVVQYQNLSNGRSKIFLGIDVSASLGWFVTVFPMLHKVTPTASPKEQVLQFNQAMKQVPKSGMGFEALKFMSQDDAVKQAMQTLPQPDFRVNVLTPNMRINADDEREQEEQGQRGDQGQAGNNNDVVSADVFSHSDESPGQTKHYGKMRVEAPAFVKINAVRGNVEVRIASRDNIFSLGKIEKVTDLYLQNLADLIDALYE